jgi:hypothetical protein
MSVSYCGHFKSIESSPSYRPVSSRTSCSKRRDEMSRVSLHRGHGPVGCSRQLLL